MREEIIIDTKELLNKLIKKFDSREGFLFHQLITLSMTQQSCDVTFYKRKPAIAVKIDQKINIALMYGASSNKLNELLANIKLSNGEEVSFNEIWTINPMPDKGFSEEELRSVDMSEAEEKVGPNGETLRKMIADTYHCVNKDEEDYYLRRFIAS